MGVRFPRSILEVRSGGCALFTHIFIDTQTDDILNSNSVASPLSKIDGVDAIKFIEDLVFRAAAQDPDAGCT